MKSKLLNIITSAIIVLALLSFYGWSVRTHGTPGKAQGLWGNFLVTLTSFPDLVTRAAEEVEKLPGTFVPTHPDFEPINRLDYDLNVLVTYTNEAGNRAVEVRNLRTQSIEKSWEVKGGLKPHHRVMHPLLLSNDRVVYATNGHGGIYCMNDKGEQLWHQSEIGHHHSMNKGLGESMWVCAYDLSEATYPSNGVVYEMGGVKYQFLDNYIVQLDTESGALLFKRSMAELLLDKGLEHLIIKSVVVDDPIHLNDVQPVLESSEYMLAGDVFLSFRTSSVLLHYRPSNDSIIRVIEGPLTSQHDVDIIDGKTIAFFNNNAPTKRFKEDGGRGQETQLLKYPSFSSHISYYDLSTRTFSTPNKEVYAQHGVYSFTEGLFEELPNGDVFIEEQNPSLIWVFRQDSLMFKGILPSHHEGHHHLLNWSRPVD